MPDFDMADVLGIFTPSTIVAVVCGGILLAAYLWMTAPRVLPVMVFRAYVFGLAFLALMGAGRWADLSAHWEAWIGTAALWTIFLSVAYASVLVWRSYKRARYPSRVRRNGV